MATSWQPPQRDLGTYPQQGFGQSSSAISTELQPFCNPDDIVDSDVAIRALNRAQVGAVDPAVTRQPHHYCGLVLIVPKTAEAWLR